MVTREEAAHALVGQPFAFEVRGGLLTVHTSASVKGEQWKQRWQQCMRDVQRGDAVCAEAIQATHMFSGDAYHLLHVKYEDEAGHRVWFRSRLNRERMYGFVARPRLRVPSHAAMCSRLCGHRRIELQALRPASFQIAMCCRCGRRSASLSRISRRC